jgi:alkanesulfonate monooxygenase SsuD/methylene tetrahydromethanopterin reductase-like flavin-dependent oxidoreductase (luciferase family)
LRRPRGDGPRRGWVLGRYSGYGRAEQEPGGGGPLRRRGNTGMRLVWSEERSVRFDGEIYTLKGLKPGPHPIHEIGIWVGAAGPACSGS